MRSVKSCDKERPSICHGGRWLTFSSAFPPLQLEISKFSRFWYSKGRKAMPGECWDEELKKGERDILSHALEVVVLMLLLYEGILRTKKGFAIASKNILQFFFVKDSRGCKW